MRVSRRLAIGKNVPASPNYQGAAQQQEQSGQQNVAGQTMANRANQTNAFGASSQWSLDPATGQWTQNAGFGGPLGGAVSGLEGQAAANAGTPVGTGDQARQQAVSNMYGAETSMLDPQWRQAGEMNQAQLANQGLDPTSAAARAQNNQFGAAQNQAYAQARGQAEQLGNEAQGITFGENVTAHQLPLQELQMLGGLSGQSGYNQAGVADPLQALQAAQSQGQFGLQQAGMNNQIMGEYGQAGGQLLSQLPFLLG